MSDIAELTAAAVGAAIATGTTSICLGVIALRQQDMPKIFRAVELILAFFAVGSLLLAAFFGTYEKPGDPVGVNVFCLVAAIILYLMGFGIVVLASKDPAKWR